MVVKFVLPAGRYVITTRYGNKTSRANVNLDPNDIVTQRFSFKGRAPARQPRPVVKRPQPKDDKWTHTHVPGKAPATSKPKRASSLSKEDDKYEVEQYFPSN